MKLLFDQNLSPRLPLLLSDLFPDSLHVREVGLKEATDTEIWNYGKLNGFVIISKDSDFQQRSLLLGPPPKVIWIGIGNASVMDTEVLIRSHSLHIIRFGQIGTESYLIIN